ncbi:MAG: isoprenylcysteine carboxylmethyltransferase family protein [Bacteroidales bacterium]|nr:isoprenylcysteine carboxylmethyltransferase family protein [Bacteroidales bacterium]
MKNLFWPYFYVFVQFLSLAFLLASAPVFAKSVHGMLVEAVGFFLGILAILNIGINNFRVTPLPKSDAKFVATGIYEFVRHPMYFAQLLVVGVLVIEYFTWIRLVVLAVLCVNLLFKMRFEERKLLAYFPEYKEYIQKSWHFLPYIF